MNVPVAFSPSLVPYRLVKKAQPFNIDIYVTLCGRHSTNSTEICDKWYGKATGNNPVSISEEPKTLKSKLSCKMILATQFTLLHANPLKTITTVQYDTDVLQNMVTQLNLNIFSFPWCHLSLCFSWLLLLQQRKRDFVLVSLKAAFFYSLCTCFIRTVYLIAGIESLWWSGL